MENDNPTLEERMDRIERSIERIRRGINRNPVRHRRFRVRRHHSNRSDGSGMGLLIGLSIGVIAGVLIGGRD